jgi:hypothetical protein
MNLDKFFEYILFPGITIHELAHLFACLITNSKIKKVKLLSFTDGYVVHESSRSYKDIIISLFPFFFNILLAIIFAYLIKTNINIYLKIILAWLSIAALFFSIPSRQDTKNVFSAINKIYTKNQPIWMWIIKIILLPLTLIIIIISWIFNILDQSIVFRVILIFLWIYIFFL